MSTECSQFIFGFHPQKRREIRAQFDGGAIPSDGGGLLLREVEKRVRFLRQFAACFTDYRNPDLIEHPVEELMAWCEANRVEYLLGLAKNDRLKAEIAKEMGAAKVQYQQTGRAARLFKEFVYQTRESWSRARRVVAKAEHLEKGENPRFVVTSLGGEEWSAQALYEELYCARGDMEN